MARTKPGIGRGLEAILSASGERGSGGELRELSVELIEPSQAQPRRNFDEDSLQGLAASVAEQGLLQPVLVRPRADGKYELIAGERRWRAARIACLSTIPALVRPRDAGEALEIALTENMAREDLSPLEEARACAALIEQFGLTHEQVGRRVGRSRVAVSNLVRLLELPDEVLEMLQAGTLSEGHGRALLIVDDHTARSSLARVAVREGWSVRTLEARARESGPQPPRTRITARRRRGALHPDQEQAMSEIADALGTALGADVRVRAARDGGYEARLSFDTPQEALELARRLRGQLVA